MPLAEAARERDVYKYYRPWLDVSHLESVPANYSFDDPSSTRETKASHDRTLTAIAQLGTLRLDVKRGFVFLIDRTTEIVLAEATRSLSLIDDDRHDQDDQIWIGQARLPRDECVDQHVFGSSYTTTKKNGEAYTAEALVIPELREDERFKDRPYVDGPQGARFYAGVPIITKAGHKIGVYAVSDNEPRHGLTYTELRFMQDAAQTVSEHLEMVKNSYNRDRGERFADAITTFIEGLTAMKHRIHSPVNDDKKMTSNHPDQSKQAVDPQSAESKTHGSDFTEGVPRSSTSTPKPHADPDSATANDVSSPSETVRTNTSKPVENSTAKDIRYVFNRAAHVIRSSTLADGCMFFDASGGLFAENLDHSLSSISTTTNHFEEDADVPLITARAHNNLQYHNIASAAQSKSMSKNEAHSNGADPEHNVQIFGSSFASENEVLPRSCLKQGEMKKCFRRYPYGKVFFFDDYGNVLSTDDVWTQRIISGGGGAENYNSSTESEADVSDGGPRDGSYVPTELFNHLRGVKWVMFLPLFSYSHGRWFAGGFLWSKNSELALPEEEMPYLKAFGSTLMSEVASLESLNSGRQKTQFIASISHELRSPLHGILGSLEFLTDTMTTAYQMNLVSSIETCGKTLLDTIDHLLDFAKINNLSRVVTRRASRRSLQALKRTGTDISGISTSLTTTFDLALLTEEVIEATFSGQTFRHVGPRGQSKDGAIRAAVDEMRLTIINEQLSPEKAVHAGSAKFSGKVFVVLDVQRAQSWWVTAQPGALRRIIMNVFGNAIKYCDSGMIEVTCGLTEDSKLGNCAQIDVKDTGSGMSREFMQNHLFTAFAQEDSFAQGTGLGLSITKQIVDNLNGRISIRSEKGVGTTVKMTIPIQAASPKEGTVSDDEVMQMVLGKMRGKSLCLLNPQKGGGGKQSQMSKLTSSIATTCSKWFNVEVVQGSSMDEPANIYVYAEPPPIEYLLEQHKQRKSQGKISKEAALIIICTNAFEAASLRTGGVSHLVGLGRIIEVISQPVGPRKLAKVLLQCLSHLEERSTILEGTPTKPPVPLSVANSEAKRRAAMVEWSASTTLYDAEAERHRPAIDTFKWKSEQPTVDTTPHEIDDDKNSPIEFGQLKIDHLHKSASNPMGANKEPTRHKPYVLLVDDNPINLKLLVTFMKKIKLPYAEAMNGQEAFEKFKTAAPDRPFNFVLMDLQMPVMDGLESTRKIREYEKEVRAHTPDNVNLGATIIAITGVGSANVQQDCMDAGMSQFLMKPIKFKSLQQLLEHHDLE